MYRLTVTNDTIYMFIRSFIRSLKCVCAVQYTPRNIFVCIYVYEIYFSMINN